MEDPYLKTVQHLYSYRWMIFSLSLALLSKWCYPIWANGSIIWQPVAVMAHMNQSISRSSVTVETSSQQRQWSSFCSIWRYSSTQSNCHSNHNSSMQPTPPLFNATFPIPSYIPKSAMLPFMTASFIRLSTPSFWIRPSLITHRVSTLLQNQLQWLWNKRCKACAVLRHTLKTPLLRSKLLKLFTRHPEERYGSSALEVQFPRPLV